MIYKEYSHTICQATEYNNEYTYKELFVKLQEGWEIITSFCHTHPENKGGYEYDVKTGQRRDLFEIGNPRVTFILGRNEAPKALYGK